MADTMSRLICRIERALLIDIGTGQRSGNLPIRWRG